MPLDWVDWIDYNGVTFSVELLGGVWDRAALTGSFFTQLIVLIYITCYQLSLQEPQPRSQGAFPWLWRWGGRGTRLGQIYLPLFCVASSNVFYAFLRSTSSLWCTRTMRASVQIHLAPLRDLIKKPELLWYDVLLFFIHKGTGHYLSPRAGGGRIWG